jgi:multidrug efflux pump subunit AcrA (membrane-fusion protein)
VFVTSRFGRPSARRVTPGTSTSQFVEIKSGLREGEVVRAIGP